jgi:hypothetical protein
MSDIAGDPIGGFELRLLEELELLVEAPSSAVRPTRSRWLPRSRLALVLVVLALMVGATATSIGAWRLLAQDARKATIVSTLRRGGHVGPLITSDGDWSLYADGRGRGRTNWELSSQGEKAVGTFLGRDPIELTSVSGASGYELLAGQVNAPKAASVAVLLPDGSRIPVQLEGKLFLVALAPAQRHPEAVLALNAAGRVVARARP